MTTMRTKTKKKMKKSMRSAIESMKKSLKTELKTNENKPIPTNIEKMKDKAAMKPREKNNNRMTMETQSYRNKKPTHKEVNLEDPQGRADQCRDSSL
jgi:hypothetical protein